MTDEKKKRNQQQEMNLRRELVTQIGWLLLVVGFVWASVQAWSTTPYSALRGDEYMDDPGIPYNERDNATYTFTDQFLKETFWRLMWYVVPGILIGVVGVAMYYFIGPLAMMRETEVHKTYCNGNGEARYCAECGLKLSELERKE